MTLSSYQTICEHNLFLLANFPGSYRTRPSLFKNGIRHRTLWPESCQRLSQRRRRLFQQGWDISSSRVCIHPRHELRGYERFSSPQDDRPPAVGLAMVPEVWAMAMGNRSNSVWSVFKVWSIFDECGQVLAKIVGGMVFHTSYRTLQRHAMIRFWGCLIRIELGYPSASAWESCIFQSCFSTSRASSSNFPHFSR